VELQIENKEVFPLAVVTLPLNVDPGAAPSQATVQSWEMNPFSVVRTLSSAGGQDKTTIKQRVDCRTFVGAGIQRFDDSYAALVNANPANNIYHPFSIYSMGVVLSSGCFFNLRIALELEFYERLPLTA